MASQATLPPPAFMPSDYGPALRPHAIDTLRGLVSVPLDELFPSFAPPIATGAPASLDAELERVRRATREALARVDMSRIEAKDTVNILASEHGFGLMGGWPYAEMVKTIREVVIERTGCRKVSLRLAIYRGFREADEVAQHFGFNEAFEGRVKGLGPFDQGVEVETAIGPMHLIKRAFDGTKFIHAYYDDPREMYFNRLLYKSFKSFCMSYARYETRSVYHSMFGNRSGSIIPRALFDSDFIQQRYAFSSVLCTTPMGVTGIDATTDLYAIDRRITRSHLETYGRMQRLFAEIKDCVAVWDGGRWGYYLHGGGLIFGTLLTNHSDAFDLDQPVVAGFMQSPTNPVNFSRNKNLRGIVVNQAWVGAGIPYVTMPFTTPMYIVGEEQAQMWREDPTNPLLMDRAKVVESLEQGIAMACEKGQTDKLIVFDGSYGHLTCSESLAALLRERAPAVDAAVGETLLPKWLAQRGLA
ncbi:hypothetical protein [Novosphingobium olei]|uniref:hypothetical protein n=1 Tax=Novosphingobium olei TaxID=2728851 RepID=UPI00308B677C|nr:hypothetical protein NSDW_22630 [Novosphingobium olei]